MCRARYCGSVKNGFFWDRKKKLQDTIYKMARVAIHINGKKIAETSGMIKIQEICKKYGRDVSLFDLVNYAETDELCIGDVVISRV